MLWRMFIFIKLFCSEKGEPLKVKVDEKVELSIQVEPRKT